MELYVFIFFFIFHRALLYFKTVKIGLLNCLHRSRTGPQIFWPNNSLVPIIFNRKSLKNTNFCVFNPDLLFYVQNTFNYFGKFHEAYQHYYMFRLCPSRFLNFFCLLSNMLFVGWCIRHDKEKTALKNSFFLSN